MFPSIVDVLEIMSNERNFEQRFQATILLKCMQSFDFEFSLLLIKFFLDKHKLLRLVEFYPNDFSLVDLVPLETQLNVYIMDVSSDNNF